MTPEEFVAQLPDLANNDLPIKPPFVFNGLSARVFPLRASLDTLQQLCDGYLNVVPPQAGRFRAALPYVYLMVIDYGQLEQAIASAGWFAQLEVFFAVPVEWYKLVNGRWVFHDWAVMTPYIFVNDDFSVPMGRTVYGFPKILSRVTKTDSQWIKSPIAPVTLARIETMVFPEAYTGGSLEMRVFLEVERTSVSNLRVPFNSASPMTPWVMASHWANAVGGWARDAQWMAQAMRIFPVNPGSYPQFLPEMLARMGPWFAPAGRGFIQNSLNLKQFRRCEEPSKISYQALTNGQMLMTGFNGGGLLGEDRVLLGDLSGGLSIRLYQHSSLPIVRTLGLEMNHQWRNDDVSVAELKPVMPFWIDVDLKYDGGANLAWRSDNGIWKDETGAPFDPAEQSAADFNDTVTTEIEAIAGPFQFTGATIRVIPLLADEKKLQKFVDDFLNKPLKNGPIVREDDGEEEHVEFEVWARPSKPVNAGSPIRRDLAYVYLTASSCEDVSSETNNVGDWARYELAFTIPVKWKRRRPDGKCEVVGVGLVPAFTFVDTSIAAISRFEIQGIEARTANFVRPESVWLSDARDTDPRQTLLCVNAEVWPALGAGQKATMQPVVEISRDVPNAGLGEAPHAPWRWAEDLKEELAAKKGTKLEFSREMKVARALALEILGNRTPVAVYTMKQFRDVADPDKACYQSLVRVPRVLSEVFDIREIEDTLAVRIHDYPTLNIVDTLGIQATRLADDAMGIVYSAQGVRPFFVRATVDEPLAERLISRAGTTQWTLHKGAFRTLLSDAKNAPRIKVDLNAEKLQDLMDPSRTAATVFQACQRREAGDERGVITVEDARNALAKADAQIVIESILSREWSNSDPNARWRKGRMELLKTFSSLPEGGELKPFVEAELYRRTNNLLATRPGAVAMAISLADMLWAGTGNSTEGQPSNPPNPGRPVADWQTQMEKIIKNQIAFTRLRLSMELSVDTLASVVLVGLRGLQEGYQSVAPPVQPLHIPTAQELFEEGKKILESMEGIQGMPIAGEPSPQSDLDAVDPVASADHLRLGELLETLRGELKDEVQPDDSTELQLEFARAHEEEFRQLVDLSRRYCDLQYQALLNKLSHAYQKPDFCIRRDAVGADRDRLLPLALSWDQDWYYGAKLPFAK